MMFTVLKFRDLFYILKVGFDCTLSHHTIRTSTFYQNPSQVRIISVNPIMLNLCLSASSEAFIYIFNSSYTL